MACSSARRGIRNQDRGLDLRPAAGVPVTQESGLLQSETSMIRIIFPLLFGIATLLSVPALADQATLAHDAPDSYTVVRGDTLWDISGRFLRQPWRWPEVWRLNRDQIRNPHLIYPGQIVVLDRSGPYLSIGRRIGGPLYEKRFPQIHSEEVDSAIPSIPMQIIEPFLTRPLVVDDAKLAGAGTVVATETSRVFMGAGDTVFAKGVEGSDVWQVFRPARPLVDPVTNEVLGHEAMFLGTARVTGHGRPATLKLVSSVEEIGVGDRLVVSERPEVFSFVPHAPDAQVEGRLIGIYRGVVETGRHNVVTLNIGSRAGLERGHVLALHRERGSVVYKDDEGGKETFDLPQQRYGLAFVFRVFDRVAYALVMDADGPVTVGDSVRKP
ncbi:LysM peptidoglycan-binding domain-containing protein [Aromatoleum aromaticum]|nr:LysM peptidoglycan-binding domain-containing protein [Aromatoleum aromaticum]